MQRILNSLILHFEIILILVYFNIYCYLIFGKLMIIMLVFGLSVLKLGFEYIKYFNIYLYAVVLTLALFLSLERDSASTAGAREPGGDHLYIKTGLCMGPHSSM